MINRNVSSIVVPLDKEGVDAFFAPLGEGGENDFICYRENGPNYLVYPLTQEDMYMLLDKLFFEAINQELELWIADGEEEYLFYEENHKENKISALIDYLSSAEFKSIVHSNGKRRDNDKADYYAGRIILMAKKALHFKTCIAFIFTV